MDSTLAAAEKNPEKRDFLMRFMNAVEPTLTDAVWYQQYGAVRHPMVAQLGDMLGFGSHA